MRYRLYKIIFMVLFLQQLIYADSLLLNEYNGVTSNHQLANNGYDTHFGNVDGNGGDWIEFVVVEDYLDLRNAKITMTKYKYGKVFFTASFPNFAQLAHLRKGTIITISDEPTDLSYSPMDTDNPDWTININHSELQNQVGTFNIDSVNSLGVSIKSLYNRVLMNANGEIITGGISSDEIFKLKKEPNSNIEVGDPAYGDDNGQQIISTFGEPNQWIENGNIVHQNFNNLRDINSSINRELLLNEYDAVASNRKLKLDGDDTYFGKVYDNGGSWVELVVLKDRTDLRDAKIKIYSYHTNLNWVAKFPNSELFSNLRSGTIITISDSVATDLSYDPFNETNPDWTINLKSTDLTQIEGNFATDNDEIIVKITSAYGGVEILEKSGEGISGNGVDNREVYKLKKDPYFDITPHDSTYGDDYQHKALSTFGTPNHWDNNGNLITQDFTNLRVIAMKHNFQEKDTSLMLNEYNAVSSNQYLKDSGSDTHFGTVAGNGGSWLEMIVTKDFINIQNMTLKIYEDNNLTFSGKIPPLLTLAFLRKGTIITISNEPTDMNYSPFVQNGEGWTLNINANELTDTVGTFNINDNNIKISLVDNNGKELLANSGEGVWKSVVDNQEVYKLKSEPTVDTTPFDNYGDDNDAQAISTFLGANKWKDVNGTLHTQNMTLQKDKDLNETEGIVTVNINGLNISDGESLQYVAPNNSMWITDDDSHHLFELDLATKEVKSVFDDRDFGTFAPDIEDYCHNGIGICDIESIAYDDNNDTLYVFSGDASSTSAVFKLTRNSSDENFTISDYRKFAPDEEYPGAVFADGEFLVSKNKDIYKYDFNTNQTVGSSLYHLNEAGYILGLAYKDNTMYILTAKKKLLIVDWQTKELKNKYNMRENGVADPRGVEVINNKLYILEGVNTEGSDIIAPQGHALKNAIHIYQLYPEAEPPSNIYVPQDYSTIEEAVAHAGDGSTIILDSGTYYVNGEIIIHQNNLKIVSKYYTTGDESYISSTIIKGNGDKDTHMFEGDRDNSSANAIEFIGLTVKDTGKFVTFAYGDNNLVDHCIIKDIGRDSISFDKYAVGTVTYCTIINSGDDGIDIDTRKGENGAGFHIAYNTIIGSHDDGMEIHLWYYQDRDRIDKTIDFDIHDNIIKNSHKDAIQLIDFDVTQAKNGVDPTDAIDYPSATKRTFHISHNTIYNNGQVGVGAIFQSTNHTDSHRPPSRHFEGANMREDIEINDNNFTDNKYHILGGENMSVHNNDFIGASAIALKRVKGDSIIQNNTFIDNNQDFEDCNN